MLYAKCQHTFPVLMSELTWSHKALLCGGNMDGAAVSLIFTRHITQSSELNQPQQHRFQSENIRACHSCSRKHYASSISAVSCVHAAECTDTYVCTYRHTQRVERGVTVGQNNGFLRSAHHNPSLTYYM